MKHFRRTFCTYRARAEIFHSTKMGLFYLTDTPSDCFYLMCDLVLILFVVPKANTKAAGSAQACAPTTTAVLLV